MYNDTDIETDSRSAKASPNSNSDSVSLAFLFYVMTLSGIVAACVRMVIGNEFATWPTIWAVVGGYGATCWLAGQIMAYQRHRTVAGTMIGGVVGALLGVVAGLITLIPAENYFDLLNAAFGGTLVLVVIMLILTRFQRQPNL